ncbi:MAG TPA: pyridoxamine 5'-phosphate oxidase family protein [Thermoanaerobaculia bacterium]|nr:pyridoxamine 5'-phosphate oxidase family protein [Thermoanaerobaculia bacterium]
MPYHSGELAVQARAGVASPRIGVHDTIPPVAAQFLAAQQVVIASSIDGEGRLWASLLAGDPGFACTVDWQTAHITPTAGNEVFDGDAGLLAIEFATRRRMRVNGRLHHEGDTLVVETREVYSNCPQYITPQPVAVPCLGAASRGSSLTEEQRLFIRGTNTFFIATAHQEAGADASHRGGPAGFVHAEADRVSWPDYRGNNMFNTLGNLAVDPRCGLLFTDFQRTLQLTGSAAVAWEGTTRRVEMRVEGVIYHAPCAAHR